MGVIDFLKRVPTKNELKGSFGEWMAQQYSKMFVDAPILHDILINGAEGYTSQIDMLMFGERGIYVFEIKLYDEAKIYGDGKKTKWYYYKHGKKYEIYSPIKQNDKHIKYLKNLLKDFGEIPFFSIVTLICEDFKVSNINPDNEIKTAVCSSLPAMYEAVKYFTESNPVMIDEEKKKQLYDFIVENQIKGKESRLQHKQNIIDYKKGIEEMKEQKICPYCKIPLVLREGKYGEFYGCANFPKCRYTLKKDV